MELMSTRCGCMHFTHGFYDAVCSLVVNMASKFRILGRRQLYIMITTLSITCIYSSFALHLHQSYQSLAVAKRPPTISVVVPIVKHGDLSFSWTRQADGTLEDHVEVKVRWWRQDFIHHTTVFFARVHTFVVIGNTMTA